MRARIAIGLFVFSTLAGTGAAAASERELIRAALAASGASDPIDLTLGQVAVEHEIDRIVERIGLGRPSMRRARRLHELLQNRYLRAYDPAADGLVGILDHRSYNCLSATMLYGLSARRLGFEAQVLERPNHLRIRVSAGGRAADIETTQRYGFDVLRAPEWAVSGAADETRAGGGPQAESPSTTGYRELPLEAAVGFAWMNRAWRDLEAGRPVAAAEHAAAAASQLAASGVADGDELQRLFARAFLVEYEAGRFENARAIARHDVSAFPDVTTSRDRLLAATVKVIEDACAGDDPARAEAVLTDTERLVRGTRDAERSVRQLAPVVVAAAVRVADFELAQNVARRYAEVEPDTIEAERLVSWVESRRAGVSVTATETPAESR